MLKTASSHQIQHVYDDLTQHKERPRIPQFGIETRKQIYSLEKKNSWCQVNTWILVPLQRHFLANHTRVTMTCVTKNCFCYQSPVQRILDKVRRKQTTHISVWTIERQGMSSKFQCHADKIRIIWLPVTLENVLLLLDGKVYWKTETVWKLCALSSRTRDVGTLLQHRGPNPAKHEHQYYSAHRHDIIAFVSHKSTWHSNDFLYCGRWIHVVDVILYNQLKVAKADRTVETNTATKHFWSFQWPNRAGTIPLKLSAAVFTKSNLPGSKRNTRSKICPAHRGGESTMTVKNAPSSYIRARVWRKQGNSPGVCRSRALRSGTAQLFQSTARILFHYNQVWKNFSAFCKH